MKLRTLLCLTLFTGLMFTISSQADEPEQIPRSSSRGDSGFFLDLGRFSPYTRGIVIDVGPKNAPNQKRRVNVQVGPNPYVPVDINVNTGGGPANPTFNSPQTQSLPGEELLGEDALGDNSLGESADIEQLLQPRLELQEIKPQNSKSQQDDLLGSPAEDEPTFIPPPVPKKQESSLESDGLSVPLTTPQSPTDSTAPEDSTEGVKLEPAPEPVKPIAPPVPSSISSLLQPKDIPPANPNVIRSAPGPAYLGVSAQPVSGALASQLANSLPAGVGLQVTNITPGSAAEAAGLSKHDILVMYDGKPIKSFKDLVRYLKQNEAGEEIKLTIIRALKPQEIKVILGTRPEQVSTIVPPQQFDFFHATPPPPPAPAVVYIPFYKTPALVYEYGGIEID